MIFSENEAENLQNGDVHLVQILAFEFPLNQSKSSEAEKISECCKFVSSFKT